MCFFCFLVKIPLFFPIQFSLQYIFYQSISKLIKYSHIMSYTQRFIIGLIILISSYSLFTGAQERNQFHNAVAQISRLAGCTYAGCYKCIQMERNIAVIVSFTAGMALLMDSGIILAIITQVGFIILQGVLIRNPTVADLQPILVNFALLVFLVKNYSEAKAEAAAQQAKNKVANAASADSAAVQGSSAKTHEEKSASKPASNNSKNTKTK